MTQNPARNDLAIEVGGGQGRPPRIVTRNPNAREWSIKEIVSVSAVFLVVAILVACGAGTYITHLK